MLCSGYVSHAREVSITGKVTVSPPHHPHADDAQASLRIELVGQLAAAQLVLEAAIAELSRTSGGSAALAASRLQLASVSDLLGQVGNATMSRLAELRS